jgi:hypothetical protein
MGGYDGSDLRRLQERAGNLDARRGVTLGMGGGLEATGAGDVGTRHRWRYLIYLAIALLVGIFLTLTPWLPGLGVFVITAVTVAVIPVTLHAWMGD